MSNSEKEEFVRKAVKRYFVEWAFNEKVENALCLGKSYDKGVNDLLEKLILARKEIEGRFRELSNDELARAAGHYKAHLNQDLETELSELCKEARRSLPRYTRCELVSLGVYPDELADYDYWAMRDMFGTEDFVWLSIGLQPSKELKKYTEKFPTHQPKLDSILKKEADLRFKLMITARDFQPNYQYISADVAHEWLQKVELHVPKGLKDALELAWDRKNGVKRPSKGASVNGKAKLDARERKSLLKLVIGMAIAGYKYHPSQDRNNVVADIEDDLAKLGIGLDQKTIRKHLQKGIELLPDDALQE